MKRIGELILQLLFPPRCPVCGEVVPIGKSCTECAASLAALELSLNEMYASNELRELHALDSAVAVYRYSGEIKEIVHSYKFREKRYLVHDMAAKMAALALEVYDGVGLDMVTCVPAADDESGHGERLARAAAKRMKLPYADALQKVRRTEKQHLLDAAHRAVNLKGAFAAIEDCEVTGKTVLLCDDVFTSGATMEECAKMLKSAGARQVFGLAFASTLKEEPDENG